MNLSLPIQSDLSIFLEEIESMGYELTLVGGACRDFFLTSKLARDLDFEIRSRVHHDVLALKDFLHKKQIQFEELSYEIIRFEYLDYSLEFSPPRIEVNDPHNKTHHHFEAKIDFTLDHSESFKRRDFTINAIGIVFGLSKDMFDVVDPYQGLEDLKNKKLRAINDDFFHDYVRFLRAIRFSMTLAFEIDQSILSQLSSFNLEEISYFHLRREAQKSQNIGLFFSRFFELVEKYKIAVNPKVLSFRYLINIKEAKTVKDFLVSAFKENTGVDEICEIFTISLKEKKELTSFYQSYIYLKNVSNLEVKKIKESTFEDLENLAFLKELKNYFDKNEWAPYFEVLFDVNQYEKISLNNEDLMTYLPTKRSFYKAYLFVQTYL